MYFTTQNFYAGGSLQYDFKMKIKKFEKKI